VSFSKDGKTVAAYFLTDRGTEFWLIPFPSGKPKRILELRGPSVINRMAWMPDNRRIVLSASFQTTASQPQHLMMLDMKTEKITQLTSGFTNELFPAVDHEGKRILFTSVQVSTI
jgi:Tol biopolymer transport system component